MVFGEEPDLKILLQTTTYSMIEKSFRKILVTFEELGISKKKPAVSSLVMSKSRLDPGSGTFWEIISFFEKFK